MSESDVTLPVDSQPEITCPRCGAPRQHHARCPSCGESPEDPRLGTLLAEKYRIEERIGEGGMGTVYRATWEALDTDVAVKFLRGTWASFPELRERFRREAMVLARLKHPSIVALLDHGESEGSLYTVMELVEGRTLSEVIADGALTPARAGAIFDQILAVLEAAHAAGIVHRDMKPDNVMLVRGAGGAEVAKVLDFGLAHLAELEGDVRLTETGTVRGTAHYMSPEQCRGVDVGTPTDIYAVGIMLFEALTGVPPFDGGDAATLMTQQMFLAPPSVLSRGSRPDVGPGVEALLRAALAKRAEDRPTASAMRTRFSEALRRVDAASRAESASEARVAGADRSRDQRAITEPPALGVSNDVIPSAPVALWLDDPVRASRLASALAVRGVATTTWTSRGVDAVSAVVVATARDALAERLRGLRAALPKIPLLAVDVTEEGTTIDLIRAGVSDLATTSASEDQITEKVRRLLRRKR